MTKFGFAGTLGSLCHVRNSVIFRVRDHSFNLCPGDGGLARSLQTTTKRFDPPSPPPFPTKQKYYAPTAHHAEKYVPPRPTDTLTLKAIIESRVFGSILKYEIHR